MEDVYYIDENYEDCFMIIISIEFEGWRENIEWKY
jgi:hypothetical protein